MKYTVVYPYKENAAQGDELKHSLRSLCKNFKEDFEVVIVGSKPKWINDKVRVIEGAFDNTSQPAQNVAKKINALLEDPKIPASFVWMNDDIYFMNEVTINDIRQLKHLGEYNKLKNFAQKSNPYHINGVRTFDWLKEQGKRCFMYSTHTPFWYSKAKWKTLFKLLPLMEKPYLLTNLYHNYFFKPEDAIRINHHNEVSVGCYRVLNRSEYKMLSDHLDKTKFFNHSQTGYCTVVIEEIKRRFGNEKCKFEL